MEIKCKNYIIFLVKYFADKDKSGNIDLDNIEVLKKHHERAEKYINFCWKLIEHITGKNLNWWIEEYAGYDSKECAFEYLWEHYGILTTDRSGVMQFMIPKEKTELVEWIKNNLENPYTMPKKTDIRAFDLRTEAPKWRRESALNFKNKYYPTGFLKTK